jgi:hypothetical protein
MSNSVKSIISRWIIFWILSRKLFLKNEFIKTLKWIRNFAKLRWINGIYLSFFREFIVIGGILSRIFISHVNRIRAQNYSKNTPNTSLNIDFKQFKLKTKQCLSFTICQSRSYQPSGPKSVFSIWLISQ